jgi:hypothetical protein
MAFQHIYIYIYIYIYIKHKYDLFNKFSQYKEFVEQQTNYKIIILRFDNVANINPTNLMSIV